MHEYVLFSPTDTFSYQYDSLEGTFALSDLDSVDITEVPLGHDFIIRAGEDMIVVKGTTDSNRVMLLSPTDTVLEIIRFFKDKVELLRDYSQFGTEPVKGIDSFYYEPSTDSQLVALREKYNLDSIAGDGDEIERIINLMVWAHGVVRHDGSSKNPEPRNADNLITICREEDRGVNCRMMATILNEAYLATGFKSRHITCLPYDKADQDCHVIDAVFAEGLHKWLYMDPTFEAYWMDKDSNLLSIEEVRIMMIDGETLLLSGNVNWNGEPYGEKNYREYVAKNLFRFSCPLVSEYGYESSPGDHVYVDLIPVDYDPDAAGTVDSTGETGDQLITYYTTNAGFFWQMPD